ncbi:MAG: hypothetical protein IPO72_12645 [Saprospiraceae bacterium]|nr:hypothetical protein [Candidatus Vicinibacter affinis]
MITSPECPAKKSVNIFLPTPPGATIIPNPIIQTHLGNIKDGGYLLTFIKDKNFYPSL